MTSVETPKFNIHYFKTKTIALEPLEKAYTNDESGYNPYNVTKIQNYNPVYGLFFSLNENNYNNISLNHKFHIIDMMNVYNQETREPVDKHVFIKYSPLVDPIRYMIGKYKTNGESLRILPIWREEPKKIVEGDKLEHGCESLEQKCSDTHPKLINTNNASYTDNFFSFLASKLLHTHNFLNGIDYYGSFLGIQEKFKMNIIDDFEYLTTSDYFKDNMNKMFSISKMDDDEFLNFGSRSNKQKLVISNNSKHNITIENLGDDLNSGLNIESVENNDELIYEKNLVKTDSKSTNNSNSTSSNSETNYSTENDDDDDEEDNGGDGEDEGEGEGGGDAEKGTESEDEDADDWDTVSSSNCSFNKEETKFAYINDFPVQLICLEKCDGTLDELFDKDKMTSEEAASALFQIIMILITYQKAFHFTHNDLHTNNVMFVNTEIEFLYYKHKNIIYKVPTYGKIYKLIDFGRSIYRFQGKLLCSDSFANGGDAHTQYNCEPYMNEDKPRLDPNYSFDLCRLATSIYDFIIDNDDCPDEFDELQKTIYRWCLDDNGKNVLYKRNGEERYHNFKLYKMIARTVHNSTPHEQLEFPYFKQFTLSQKKTKKMGDIENIIDIDKIPCYV